MKVANDASCCLMKPRVASSLSSPVFSSSFAAQLPMKISGLLSVKASRNIIDLRIDRRRNAGRVLDIGVVQRKLGKGWSGLDGHADGRERRQQPLHHGVE